MSNLYNALGLDIGADAREVRSAFLRLAISLTKNHQLDANAGDGTAEKRFREVNQAYQILSDPARRAAYDNGLRHKQIESHRRVRKAMVATAASFMVTVGCGLYFSLSDIASQIAAHRQ